MTLQAWSFLEKVCTFSCIQVQPFLPAWLAKPSCVRKSVTEDLTPIEDIPEVHPDLQKQLRANGISSYFPGASALGKWGEPLRQLSLGCWC